MQIQSYSLFTASDFRRLREAWRGPWLILSLEWNVSALHCYEAAVITFELRHKVQWALFPLQRQATRVST